MKFAQLGLTEPLVRAISKSGHASPTPIQALAIPEILAGRDVIGAAETGTGKTAAFALPLLQRLAANSHRRHALSRKIRALIITATRELAEKVGATFQNFSRFLDLHCLTLVDRGHANSIANPLRSVEVLITTPERLRELHQSGGVDLRAVEMLVLDETDRMLDMGCLPDVQRIVSQLPLDRQTLIFSATLPQAINSLADSILRNPARIRIPPAQKAVQVVQQSVFFIGRPQKSSMLVNWLGLQTFTRAVVFMRTRQGADRVVRQLLSCGIRAEAIHGEKSLAARQLTLQKFRGANPPVLVATDLAARGIDVDGISHVINYDLPLEPETYIHRVSRIGHAGANGVSVTFCDEAERPLLRGIERLLRREIPIDRVNEASAPAETAAVVAVTRSPVAVTDEQPAVSPRSTSSGTSPNRSSSTKTPKIVSSTDSVSQTSQATKVASGTSRKSTAAPPAAASRVRSVPAKEAVKPAAKALSNSTRSSSSRGAPSTTGKAAATKAASKRNSPTVAEPRSAAKSRGSSSAREAAKVTPSRPAKGRVAAKPAATSRPVTAKSAAVKSKGKPAATTASRSSKKTEKPATKPARATVTRRR